MIFGYYDNEPFGGYIPRWNARGGSNGDLTSRVLVVDGDSFLVATIPLGDIFGFRFRAGWGDVVTCYNEAVAGNTYSNMADVADTEIIPKFITSGSNPLNVVLMGLGFINQVVLAGNSVEQAAVYGEDYYDIVSAAGGYVIGFYNQATHYNTFTSENPTEQAVFRAWEDPDPDFTANSRWHADEIIDEDPELFADEFYDWRLLPYWATRFYDTDPSDRFPAMFGVGNSVNESHPNQFGVAEKATFAFESGLVELFQLPPVTSVVDQLWAFWPMWTGDPSQAGQARNLDYWCCGVNYLYHDVHVVQNALSATAGQNPLAGFGNIGTSIASTVPHTLHARTTGFSVSVWINPVQLTNIGITELYLATVVGEYMLFWDSVTNQYGFKIWQTSGGTQSAVRFTTYTPAVGVWAFVSGGYDGENIFISVNGGTPVTLAVPSVYDGTSNEFNVGLGLYASYRDLFWHTRELTSNELNYLYNAGTPRLYLFA